MMIDEAIIQSRIQLTIWEEGCTSKLDNSPKAVETLIEIAKKYQKIQQIIEDWEHDKGWALEMSELYWLDRVKEVIEDENDD